jgi:hypothetical protein
LGTEDEDKQYNDELTALAKEDEDKQYNDERTLWAQKTKTNNTMTN